MSPPQPRKGPTRVPQNPLMGGVPQIPRVQFGAMPNGQMVPRDVLSPNQQLDWERARREAGGSSPISNPLMGDVPQVPRAQFGAMPGGQMIPREVLNPAQQADWERARREAGGSPLVTNPLTGGATSNAAAWGSITGGEFALPAAPAAPSPTLQAIQQITQRGQLANSFVGPQSPLSTISPGAQSQMGFMQRQEAARQQNTRYGDFTPPAGQAYSNSLSLRPEDIRSRLANREGSMQPGGAQMQQRFAPESPLGMRADTFQRGQMGVDRGEGVFIQEGGRGSNQTYLGFNNTQEGALAAAQEMARARREDRTAPGYRSPEERAALLQQGLDRRQSAIEAGLPKQRAEEKRMKLQDKSLKRAVTRGLNPLSPQAQALYPEAAGRLRAARMGGGQQNAPANAANPFASGPGGSVTPEDKVNAKTTARALVQGVPGPPDKDGNPTPGTAGNPFLQQLGISGDLDVEQSLDDVHQGLVANMESDTSVTPTVQDLRALHGYVLAMRTQHGDKSLKLPQTFIKSPPIASFQHRWDEFANMPANASDQDFEKWYSRFAGTSRHGMSIF
jgi:hypothetical protein